jgi:hypothetical protein
MVPDQNKNLRERGGTGENILAIRRPLNVCDATPLTLQTCHHLPALLRVPANGVSGWLCREKARLDRPRYADGVQDGGRQENSEEQDDKLCERCCTQSVRRHVDVPL